MARPLTNLTFSMQHKVFKTIKSFHDNSNITINKPHEGSGVVVLDRCEYIGEKNKFYLTILNLNAWVTQQKTTTLPR